MSILRQATFSRTRVITVMAIVAVVGVVALVVVRAAGPLAAFEPESGSLSGGALATGLTGASGGSALKFMAPPTPAPTPVSTDGVTAAATYGWGTPVQNDEQNNADYWCKDGGGTPGYNYNGQWGYYKPSQFSIADGLLTLTGKPTGITGANCHTDTPAYGQYRGKWEVRQKISGDASCWRPVLLLWPNAEDWGTGGGEVDFAENPGGDLTHVGFNLHYGPGAEFHQTQSQSPTIDMRQWNNYAVEWTATYIRGYVNGVKFFEDTDTSHFPPRAMHMTAQLDGSQSCNGNTQQIIDWIRVYK